MPKGAVDVNSDGSDICSPGARERPNCAFHKALLCRAGRPTTNVSAVHSVFMPPSPDPAPHQHFRGLPTCTIHDANSQACTRSKKVEFSVMPPSDIIKNGVFQPFDARLYQVSAWLVCNAVHLRAMLFACRRSFSHACGAGVQLPSRTPAPNGILDPRLVR